MTPLQIKTLMEIKTLLTSLRCNRIPQTSDAKVLELLDQHVFEDRDNRDRSLGWIDALIKESRTP